MGPSDVEIEFWSHLQGYWQRAIASRPTTAVRAYIMGGMAWFAILLGSLLLLVSHARVSAFQTQETQNRDSICGIGCLLAFTEGRIGLAAVALTDNPAYPTYPNKT